MPTIFQRRDSDPGRLSLLPLPAQLALVLSCLLPLLWIPIGWHLNRLHTDALLQSEKDEGYLVHAYAAEVEASAQAIDLTLLDLRERWQEEPQKFASKVALRQARLQGDVAFEIGIIDAAGMLVYSSAGPHAGPVSLRDRAHFLDHTNGTHDLLYISKPVLDRVSHRWSIRFSRPLRDRAGRFAGVIALSVSPDYFTQFARTVALGQNGSVSLFQTNGQWLARFPAGGRNLDEVVHDAPFLRAAPATAGFFRRASHWDGIDRQFAWRSIPDYQLIVTIGHSTDELLFPYERQQRIYLLGGAAISLLIGWLAYAILNGLRQRKASRAALEESEFRWKYALEGAGDGVWDWNIATGEVFRSRRLKTMLGYEGDEFKNELVDWERLLHPEDRSQMSAVTASYLAGTASNYVHEYRLLCKDGSWKWILSRGTVASRDAAGQPLRIIGTHTDITERKHAEQAEHEYQSSHDTLTGLANRHLLRDRAAEAIAHAAGNAQQVWIASVNLDRFKFVNDTLGHEAGDRLLQLVARRLRAELRPTDTAARVAGDEFALVLPQVADEHAVMAIVRRIMATVARPLNLDGHDYFLTCTIGIAVYPSDSDDAETLLKYAELATHRAKETGRNSLQFYTGSMNERAMHRLRLEGDLRQALQRNEFVLHYQPQVDVRTGRVVGVEALVRWLHPQLGLVPPDSFIRIAEETGLIVPIGSWVMHTACRQMKAWHDAGHGALRIGVNLSGNQFYQQDLVQSVQAILEDAGLDARCLDIELTEGMVMTDVAKALDIMRRLKALGVKLAIDDFGTGYSSLSYLKRFPIDVLKIDQSFVRNIATEPDEAAIARAIITLAQSLQLQVVAEGVETEEQLTFLRRHRCDQIQGYYFSRPLPAHELEQLLVEDKCLAHAGPVATEHVQTLLIVDDEVNVAHALYRLLRSDGYRILRATSAEEGLSLLALREVQVVLSDQRMPGMSGTEFLSKVKQLYPSTIRIMLSGYTAVDSIIEATNRGEVFRFHTKPWDGDALRKSIAEAFRYHWVVQAADREVA